MTDTSEEPNAAELAAAARARGAFSYVLSGGPHADKLSTMDAIAEALSFPDWFGRNLDALYDCLTDLSWLPAGEHVLIWVAPGALKAADPKSYLAIHGVLSDAQRAMATSKRTLTVALSQS